MHCIDINKANKMNYTEQKYFLGPGTKVDPHFGTKVYWDLLFDWLILVRWGTRLKDID